MDSPPRWYVMTPPHEASVVCVDRLPRPLRHLSYHSPAGFSWGHGGSGPADLALSLLADHLGEMQRALPPWCRGRDTWLRRVQSTRAWTLHQDFKWQVVAREDRDCPWEIDDQEIDLWIALHPTGQTVPV